VLVGGLFGKEVTFLGSGTGGRSQGQRLRGVEGSLEECLEEKQDLVYTKNLTTMQAYPCPFEMSC
jgi:hypothetical protein